MCYPTEFRTTHVTILSPIRVAAGQADGIQPRTIEVLQVSQHIFATKFCAHWRRAMALPIVFSVRQR
jgi:hypothetical protein